ncbi:MAG: TrpR-like protein, YerC/YecD [Clostridia bacterium]|nr:TrpR-like protein, YerC/YecD [Clostridia bacterium]
MNTKNDEENLEYLFRAITSIKNVEECRRFFEDLCTVPELNAMSRRLMVAKLLSENVVYSEIVSRTGTSTATISRVNRSMNYNGNSGYPIIFERLRSEKNKDEMED